MFQTYNFGTYVTSFWEFVIGGLLIFMILSFSFIYQKIKQRNSPEYRFYTIGLLIKLVGTIAFFIIYGYYYKGGDTTMYFENALIYNNLFQYDFFTFTKVYFSPASLHNYELFRDSGMFPMVETYFNEKTHFVVKFSTPFVILSGGSFLISSMLMGYFFFFPVWGLYKAFLKLCPSQIYVFISCFAVPSVVFWAGGISKDTLTLAGVSILMAQVVLFSYTLYKQKILLFFKVIFGLFLVLYTKPYIIIALFPSFLVWSMTSVVKNKISNQWLKLFVFPVFLITGVLASYLILTLFGESLDRFAIDRALETAAATQQDLKQDYYQGQSFDIGDFEPTIESVLSKIPIATFAGAFYPLPGQVTGLVPYLSVLENILILSLIVYLFINRYFFQLRYSINEKTKNFLSFFLIYSVLFSFIIGLSTSNFGALVRFRIPMSPFFMMILLTHLYYYRIRNQTVEYT
jgi:hypothetical protein